MSIKCLKAIACITLVFATSTQVAAQNYERYRPLPIESLAPQSLPSLQPEQLERVEGSDRVLVDKLNGVIVLDDAEKVDPEDANEDVVGIQYRFQATDSLVYRSGVQQIIDRRIGEPVTLRNLNEMAREIILHYRERGQPVVDVLIPEQKITAGVVQIVVVESRVSRVLIETGHHFDPQGLCRWVQCTRRGERIYESSISDDLFWLNQNPFRVVDVDLRAGEQAGTTDVVFRIDDVFPIRAYLGYDDTGVRPLGLERVNAGFIYGNFLQRDGILSYQYTGDGDFSLLEAHAFSYSQPIDRDWSFDTYGSWAGVRPSVPGLTQNGESWQVGTALTRHLIRNRRTDFSASLGFDFKSTNNNLEFGGVQVQDSAADLSSLRIGMRYFQRGCCDEYSLMTLDTFIGPGDGFTSDNTSQAFDTIRPNTDPTFIYGRLRMERLLNVGRRWQLLGRFAGQLASERLLFSETLGFGGFDSIRGYDQRVFNGDNGWLASLEFGPRTHIFGSRPYLSSLRTFAFIDLGEGYTIDPVPGELDDQFFASAGVGLRMSLNERLSLRVS